MSSPKVVSMPWNGSLNSPQFQIAYATVGSQATAQARSKKILAGLVADSDLIIELNDALLCAPEKDRGPIGERFRQVMAAQSLQVTERRFPNPAKPSFFAKLLGGGGESEACELRVFVPGAVWKSGVLDPALTMYGLRYYVLPSGADGSKLLERLNLGTISAQEIIATMDLIVFDVPCFGQMGLISTPHDLAVLQARVALG